MSTIKIKSALISVFNKDGLEPIIKQLDRLGVAIYSTGGTQKFIEERGVAVKPVEGLTGYPSILDGRVKTLHPKVFGGILARREDDHLAQLGEYEIPEIDLVIVDLYPFEETVKSTDDEFKIIEKIDIGGIALIRAAAKNFNDVVIIPSIDSYQDIENALAAQDGEINLEQRKEFARRAFKVSSNYDTMIYQYFNRGHDDLSLKLSLHNFKELRYGENPHQRGVFYGDLTEMFDTLGGKQLSYNNLVDVDAAVQLMAEFKDDEPTFAVLKHTNPCGLATRPTVLEAWNDALAGDTISAFGGILICNAAIDLATATEIDKLFYEVLIAPSFNEDAAALLMKKEKRILLKIKDWSISDFSHKTLLNGVIGQDMDKKSESAEELKQVSKKAPSEDEIKTMLFANKLAKHIKSNTIALVKNRQLVGMGSGQTSRVDALKQAIIKAKAFGFDLNGATMASDAFFPFPDCVEIANGSGIKSVIQPGGSIRDKDSIAYCDANDMTMVCTGIRHFKH